MVDVNFIEDWVLALESGDYKQGKNYLHTDGKYCCLGVACDLAVKKGILPAHSVSTEIGYRTKDDGERVPASHTTYLGYPDVLPPELTQHLGINNIGRYKDRDRHYDLVSLNDGGMPFDEIADILRRGLLEGDPDIEFEEPARPIS